MTSKSWRKLRTGSIVKMAKSGTLRKVVRKNEQSQTIELIMLVGGMVRLWCGYRTNTAGVDTTVYCIGDKKMFEVHRY
jgi:hypothetical protein